MLVGVVPFQSPTPELEVEEALAAFRLRCHQHWDLILVGDFNLVGVEGRESLMRLGTTAPKLSSTYDRRGLHPRFAIDLHGKSLFGCKNHFATLC